ncbi:hypothetical protein FIBSPDRAFT_870918 [Athelia psychrophila]|uniref:Uncharacterized protein n=1 Tax=Athelia psychrophila TaxID=1759441 RepID=A0A166ANE2_9AGAM|nr:hypothetical protein FIBSPDRAFT_870918 [Fibularhizoctonia sp. CBS 109695]
MPSDDRAQPSSRDVPCHWHLELVLRTTSRRCALAVPRAAREPRVSTARRGMYPVIGSSTAIINTSTVHRAYPGDVCPPISALKTFVHHGYLLLPPHLRALSKQAMLSKRGSSS